MPKLKAHKGAAKRFVKSASGRIKRKQANRNHILTKVTTKLKRHRRGAAALQDCDKKAVDRMLTGS